MRKMVVFNVGGALSVYLETEDKRILVDIGKSETFNPTQDFLLPLYRKRRYSKKDNKYEIDQLIISHPHMDHISGICDFDSFFSPKLLTCPNDKKENPEDDKVDMSKFDVNSKELRRLRKMYEGRSLPLVTTINNNTGLDKQYLLWLKPGDVAQNPSLTSNGECYQNNISLVNLFVVNGHRILLPGDIMKNGMKLLLKENPEIVADFKKHHLCILVAPHHGLRSAFSTELFSVIKDNKTRCLNIISEKEHNSDDNREVDCRYYESDYCMGDNNLESTNIGSSCYGRKTSQGHLCIDFKNGSRPDIAIIQDSNELVDWFN